MRISRALRVALSAAALLVVAACGPDHGSSSTVNDAKDKARAVASSSANAAAEQQVETQVTNCVNGTPTAKLLTKDGRQQVITCLKGLVPADKQDNFKQCLATTASNDKIWTHDGRRKFANAGVAACVTKETGTTPPVETSPSATASN